MRKMRKIFNVNLTGLSYSPQSDHSFLYLSLDIAFMDGGGELDADRELAQAETLASAAGSCSRLGHNLPVVKAHRLVRPNLRSEQRPTDKDSA